MKKSVLFVDDQQSVLEGLRRVLRSMRGDWEFDFLSTPRDALNRIRDVPVDVVVSDMCMPEMDGAEFLENVMRVAPQTIRIVLTGSPDESLALRAAGLVHRFLSKPCRVDDVRNVLRQAARMSDRMTNPALRDLVGDLRRFPSLPESSSRIIAELCSPESSIERLSALAARNPGLTSEFLEIVRSTDRNLDGAVESPFEAARILGIDRMRSLLFFLVIHSPLTKPERDGFSLGTLIPRCRQASEIARRIVLCECRADDRLATIAGMAAAVRDVGSWILEAQRPEPMERARALSARRRVPLWVAEREVLGLDHAEVGAALLEFWNVDERIVDAVLHHHDCESHSSTEFGAVAAVAAAEAFMAWSDSDSDRTELPLNAGFVERLGLANRLPTWARLARKTIRSECTPLDASGSCRD